MRKMMPVTMAALMALSTIPVAFATNDYTQGTQVEYTATQSEEYLITVPAKLTPGASGTVKLEGAWPDNKIIIVTADANVTLTNSLQENDKKVLNVNFAGIEETGDNTQRLTFTESVSVDDISGALFGIWDGKFNYNVSTKKIGAPVIPEGGQYTKADGTVLNPGDEFPEPATGDKYRFGDYEYGYNLSSNLGLLAWRTISDQNGWGVDTIDNYKTSYGPILETIAGKPITSLQGTFGNANYFQVAPAIPDTVSNMKQAYFSCDSLKEPAALPRDLTTMEAAYMGCAALSTAPDFSKVTKLTNMSSAFVETGFITTEDIVIPYGVTNMNTMFQRCPQLVDASSLEIPETVKSLNSIFVECPSLQYAEFVVPATVENISGAFYDCAALRKGPDLSNAIGLEESGFSLRLYTGCAALEEVSIIPDNVEFASDCFSGCTALQEIHIHCNHGSNMSFSNCDAEIIFYHAADCYGNCGCPTPEIE